MGVVAGGPPETPLWECGGEKGKGCKMTAKEAVAKLLDLKREYNTRQGNTLAKLRYEDRTWDSYKTEVHEKHIDTARKSIQADILSKLSAIRKGIDSELQAVPLAAASIRFPNVTSKDPQLRVAGEMQLASAKAVLSMDPSPDVLASEIKAGLRMGRTDFAFELVEHAKALHIDVGSILASFDGSAKLKGLEEEGTALAVVDRVGSDFSSQLQQGWQYVVLPELWPMLEESERVADMAHLDSQQVPFADSVGMKMRVAKSMGMGSELHLYDSGKP